MTAADGSTLSDEARALAAWAQVSTHAEAAREGALAIVATTKDDAARSIAHRTIGLAALEVSDVTECMSHMQLALTAARSTSDPELVAEAEMGLAAGHQCIGDRTTALRLSRRATQRAPSNARLALQRALVLDRFGESREAHSAYDRAEALATASREPGREEILARIWCNRGVLQIYLAAFEAADRDLLRSEEICREAGLGTLLVAVQANRGFLASRRGEVIAALAALDSATPAMAERGGMRLGVHQLDRCEVLMSAGLASDAVRAGRASIEAHEAAGMVADAAEARVITAQAALIAGDAEAALAYATAAERTLGPQGAAPWRALAAEVRVRATWLADGTPTRQLARAAVGAAELLSEAGWDEAAASARILAARIELGLGSRARAEAQLRLVRDSPRSPVGLRVQARCARALLCREAGDRRAARAALRAGWALLERHRATLGATELRAGASAHVAELVSIGLEMAIEDGRPREVLTWAERGRAGALAPRATAPPEDAELAALLAELRVVAGEADAAAKHGANNRVLLRRQAAIEERVRNRARLLPADERGSESTAHVPSDLLAKLGDDALIEYVVSAGEIWAVVAARGRYALRRVCGEAAAADEIEAMRVALRRLAFGSAVPQLRTAAREQALSARSRLIELVIGPIADVIGSGTPVVVPMGVLHSVPWGAVGRGVVAPSASLWARALRGESAASLGGPALPGGGDVLLVAGPRLAEVEAEVAAIAQLSSRPTVIAGADATVDVVRDAMGRADLVHLACHGHFRADNPLFSSLELHDGALSVFELERLGRAPRQMILSACDAGLSAVHPGDELLGLAAALLRLGTTGIVASVLPVPDAATRRLMVALHERLAAGDGLADALAGARATLDPERDDDLVASWAFQVIGAG